MDSGGWQALRHRAFATGDAKTYSRDMVMRTLVLCCIASLPVMASAALGGDAEAGRRLAQRRCAVCHIVEPNQHDEVADAPPFVAIGRRFGDDQDMLVFNLMGPHAKMNFALGRRAATDVAEYIRTLLK
jgi:mono/diheme cytochrome c family protein